MADESVLSDEFLRQIMNVGEVDLLVALPTHNRAGTIANVVQAVRLGLLSAFPRERAVLLIADFGSRDGSMDLALQASATLPNGPLQSLRTFHTVTAECGQAGSASFYHLLLATADLLRARASAVIAPSDNVTPEWIGRLLVPTYRKNYDLVLPLYRRHKFDGLLLRTLLYPMVSAVCGKRIHEPYCTDFGFSCKVGEELTAADKWPRSADEGSGAELMLVLSAIMNGFRPCEVFLGPKEDPRGTTDLVPALRQTVGTFFSFLDANSSAWEKIQGSEIVPIETGAPEITSETTRISPHRMHGMFRSGVHDLRDVLDSVLTPQTLATLTACADQPKESFQFPDDLWAKTIFEFAASYHKSVISRDHIIQALAPIYRGKIFEFLTTNRQASIPEIEERIEAICIAFERNKPYLLQLWNGNGGGTP
ncbi:MAG TPA: hypothetical protein VFU86_08750 [Terriglobales bacterium]|nr:hypothetical protein [Terriglobales bacterium]